VLVAWCCGECVISDQLHRVIASLYDAAFQAPFETFQHFTFDVLADVLAFDSAAWMVGIHALDQLNNACYYGRPAIDVPRYLERYGDQDGVRSFSAGDPGTPYRIEDTINLETYRTLPIYLEAGRAGGIEYAMGVTLREPVTDLFDFIVLYRANASEPFSDDDRAALGVLAPHMAAAWRHRQIVELFEVSKGAAAGQIVSTRVHAVVDDLGGIYAADAAFGAVPKESFEGWSGKTLPPPLKTFLASGQNHVSVAGLDFVLNRSAQRHILTIHGPSPETPLSAGELRTAQMFAAGETHQQIAQTLSISHHTVRNQISAAYRKLGVHSKVALARALASDA
jgi:DNA-binding CsgD family transcriptional regulator